MTGARAAMPHRGPHEGQQHHLARVRRPRQARVQQQRALVPAEACAGAATIQRCFT